ncbi:LytR/AlgR family response regulator transcription factor [Croceivirga radicis]|uniref:DNA-binding response regulator n=1 Tax=Croceivirga radicis TaxID=1929488 RepID=A0A1V6LU31_9FLAO|nr:response regulator transcription factor [Croceivirga radicis]OQD43649.1 DNA-binding response regulator [Croceivirga radicis]
MKCIIIDDEPLAADLLADYCQHLDFLEVVGVFTNPLESIPVIKAKNIDLIFLDIEMPQLSGLEFIELLDNPPLFVFTTAYSQYAVEGFDLNAVDYLLKPIRRSRFIKAVTRVKEVHSQRNPLIANNIFSSVGGENKKEDFIFIKSEYENIKVKIEDITYVQGLKDYLKVHLVQCNKPILTLMSFKQLADRLNSSSFERVHKSFLVNINHIDAVQRNRIVLSDMRIPIGERYKPNVLSRLGIS